MVYTLILLLVAVALTITYILGPKNPSVRRRCYKAGAILLAALFALRTLSGQNAYFAVSGLEIPEGVALSLSAPLIIISAVLLWLQTAAVISIILSPFFKNREAGYLTNTVFLPITVLNLGFFSINSVMLCGDGALSGFDLRVFVFGLETVLALVLCFLHMYERGGIGIPKRHLGCLLLLIPALIACMPSEIIGVLLGAAPDKIISGLNQPHRLLIYTAFALPIVLFFLLRNRRMETKRFCLLFVSIATLASFSSQHLFSSFANTSTLPLHLCHAVMYIVPLCLIIRSRRLFHFCYFIVVSGALFAITVPNYGAISPTSAVFVGFWINHFAAFSMPILMRSLGIFGRPLLKDFPHSIAAFALYFVAMLIANAWLYNYGEVDFFFLRGTFIISKIPKFLRGMLEKSVSFSAFGLEFTFFPIFQVMFFGIYLGMTLAMLLVYEYLYRTFSRLLELLASGERIRQDQIMLQQTLGEGASDQPLYKDGIDMIRLIDFSKQYGAKAAYAVKQANLEVRAGEIFGFLGPNGAGKSTIIKSIVGLQPITGGRIEICGYDVEKQSIKTKQLIGFVPDHYALYEKLTGREYINYIADIYEVPTKERNQRIEHFLEIFELQAKFDSQMKTYSHGMKQKIAIIAALIHDPKVWILDEPLTGLDPNSIFQVKETMKEHAKKGNIVFFSSHIMDVVERLCQRVAIIRKGTILTVKPMEEVEKTGLSLEEYYLKTIETGTPPEGAAK